MKFSERTIGILKNFSGITPGMIFRPGNIQTTAEKPLSVVGEAVIEEDIPEQFCIYQLNSFLANIQALDNPDLIFSSDKIIMTDAQGFSITYHTCQPGLLYNLEPTVIPNCKTQAKIAAGEITKQNLQKLFKVATLNNLSSVVVEGSLGEMRAVLYDKENSSSSNLGVLVLGPHTGLDFRFEFKLSFLNQIIIEDYDFEIQEKGKFIQFSNKTKTLTYFVAGEKDKI
jgi:hypothetical protein